jgi:hypothetical protein
VLTLADALAHQQRLSEDPDFDPSFLQLLDMTDVTELNFDTADVRKMAQATIFSPSSRRAFVVSQ